MGREEVMQILKFVVSAAASFGSGWAAAILTDVTPQKAIASGIVALCAYVLGNQQSSVSLKR